MGIYVEESSGHPMPEIEKIISKEKYNTKSLEEIVDKRDILKI